MRNPPPRQWVPRFGSHPLILSLLFLLPQAPQLTIWMDATRFGGHCGLDHSPHKKKKKNMAPNRPLKTAHSLLNGESGTCRSHARTVRSCSDLSSWYVYSQPVTSCVTSDLLQHSRLEKILVECGDEVHIFFTTSSDHPRFQYRNFYGTAAYHHNNRALEEVTGGVSGNPKFRLSSKGPDSQ